MSRNGTGVKATYHQKSNSFAPRYVLAGIVSLCALAFLPTSANAAGCTSPTGLAGEIIFNVDHKVLQYCDDEKWIGMGWKGVGRAAGSPGQLQYNGA